MRPTTSFEKKGLKAAYDELVGRHRYDRYVTFTMGQPGDGLRRTRESTALRLTAHLKKWDAVMNRKVIGKMWLKQPERRLFWFFTFEKLGVHPHVHGFVRFFTDDLQELQRQAGVFDDFAEREWRNICPGGTTDLQVIDQQEGLQKYITKDIGDEVNYEHILVPDAFFVR